MSYIKMKVSDVKRLCKQTIKEYKDMREASLKDSINEMIEVSSKLRWYHKLFRFAPKTLTHEQALAKLKSSDDMIFYSEYYFIMNSGRVHSDKASELYNAACLASGDEMFISAKDLESIR